MRRAAWSAWAFRLMRRRLFQSILSRVIAHMSFALPVQRLRETDTLLAFHHPQPSYRLHILVVPKRPWRSLLEVPPEATPFLRDLTATVQGLVREFGLERTGYRLITNGGRYQDIPHLHFHLIADELPPPA